MKSANLVPMVSLVLLMLLAEPAAAVTDLSACRAMTTDGKRLAWYDAIADSQQGPVQKSVPETQPVVSKAVPAKTPTMVAEPAVVEAEVLFGRKESEQRDQQKRFGASSTTARENRAYTSVAHASGRSI